MKENTQEAIQAKEDLEQIFRDTEQGIGKLSQDLAKLKKKIKATLKTHKQTMMKYKDKAVLEDLLDIDLALEFLDSTVENIKLPSVDQAKDYSLENAKERIKEAANYRANQSEIEGLLKEKLGRGESLNQYLISGSFAIRRAAKKVLKEQK